MREWAKGDGVWAWVDWGLIWFWFMLNKGPVWQRDITRTIFEILPNMRGCRCRFYKVVTRTKVAKLQ